MIKLNYGPMSLMEVLQGLNLRFWGGEVAAAQDLQRYGRYMLKRQPWSKCSAFHSSWTAQVMK